ncbi:hypothetical protein BB560_001359 [Smittium megazygosporum]|uniref:Pre-mRNA-splicing factor SLT11 n=1 Tax=Smittium megazygosporum TaxID=133381 RepID=A0A2T9ZHT5_9FUNG|nr:hypothetical protein BB560_001359 [Smittium megazygosporum]
MSKAESKESWEDSDFPILCEICLGENPYVRMTKQKFGDECKMVTGPKNAIQENGDMPGLPVQVRDTALELEDSTPQSDVNKQFYNQSLEKKMETGQLDLDFVGSKNSAAREQLTRMSRTNPYYKRNLPHICSFFVKGECTRGNECPYRHELPDDDPELSKQNIVDRYYGRNDPVAKKILNRNKKSDLLFSPPADKSITSLFVSGIPDTITKSDINDYFIAFGEIKSLVLVEKSKCAFVNFKHRASAEAAADSSLGSCTINGHRVKLSWGRPRPKGPQNSDSISKLANNPEVAEKLAKKGVSSKSISNNGIVLPPKITNNIISYPSQDPTLYGSSTSKD